jgi:hypothetical protein
MSTMWGRRGATYASSALELIEEACHADNGLYFLGRVMGDWSLDKARPIVEQLASRVASREEDVGWSESRSFG